MITRRKLLSTAAATGAASMLLPAIGASAQDGPSCAVAPRSGPVTGLISIVPPTHSAFSSTLATHFPALEQDPHFARIRSYAMLVTNISGKDINAFSTFWQVESPTGGYEVAFRHFFHPSEKRVRTIHFGTKGNQTRFTGQLPAIRAGATRLLTPYFNWSTNYYQKNPKLDWTRVVSSGAHASFTLHELSRATAVHVSLDAVIVDHSKVFGPDRARLARTYAIMRNAEHDAAVGVTANMMLPPCDEIDAAHISSNHDQILGYLERTGERYSASPADAFKDRLYRKVRQRQATILARRFKRSTPEQFLRTLQYLASQPKTTIKPASLT